MRTLDDVKNTGKFRYSTKTKPVGWMFWPFLRKYDDFLILEMSHTGENYYDDYPGIGHKTVYFYKEMTWADAKNYEMEELWLEVYGINPLGSRIYG